MTLSELKVTISAPTPPAGLSLPLVALWHDAKGDWDAAHRVAQDVEDTDGAWVHAYLHRKEGDDSNAAYWYRRAGRTVSHDTFDTEWEEIVTTLLAARG